MHVVMSTSPLQRYQHSGVCSLRPTTNPKTRNHMYVLALVSIAPFSFNASNHQFWCSGPPNTLKSRHSKSVRSLDVPNLSACSIWFALQPTEHLSCVPHPVLITHPIASPMPKKPFHMCFRRYILNIPRPLAPQSTSSTRAPIPQPLGARRFGGPRHAMVHVRTTCRASRCMVTCTKLASGPGGSKPTRFSKICLSQRYRSPGPGQRAPDACRRRITRLPRSLAAQAPATCRHSRPPTGRPCHTVQAPPCACRWLLRRAIAHSRCAGGSGDPHHPDCPIPQERRPGLLPAANLPQRSARKPTRMATINWATICSS